MAVGVLGISRKTVHRSPGDKFYVYREDYLEMLFIFPLSIIVRLEKVYLFFRKFDLNFPRDGGGG